MSLRAVLGKRRQNPQTRAPFQMFLRRAIRWPRSSPKTLRSRSARASPRGTGMMYVGVRCTMVTCPASRAIAGTSVTAVAPLPITATLLPA